MGALTEKWLWSIRERFEFRYARISLHKTLRRSKRTPGPAENYAKFVFVFQKGLKPCDFKGSRKQGTQKIGANDRVLNK